MTQPRSFDNLQWDAWNEEAVLSFIRSISDICCPYACRLTDGSLSRIMVFSDYGGGSCCTTCTWKGIRNPSFARANRTQPAERYEFAWNSPCTESRSLAWSCKTAQGRRFLE